MIEASRRTTVAKGSSAVRNAWRSVSRTSLAPRLRAPTMNGCRSAVRIEPRRYRDHPAACATARTATGRIRCATRSIGPSPVNDERPEEGSHPSQVAKTSWRTRPSQNTGNEMPAAAPNIAMRSMPRCTDDATPMTSATSTARTLETPMSWRVAGTRSTSLSSTGRPSAKL